MRKRLLNKQAMSLSEDPTSISRELEEIHLVGEKPSEKHRMTSGQKLRVLQSTVIEYIWEVFVSVNSSCAQPPPPPPHTHTHTSGLTPRHWHPGIWIFFALDGKFPGVVGTLELSNPPRRGRKKRANAPSSVNTAWAIFLFQVTSSFVIALGF